MGRQAAFRFGQDGPSRITVAPSMLTEASEVMPFEPQYYPVVPFLPSIVSGGGGGGGAGGSGYANLALAIANGTDEWKSYPDKLDLFWWQGDDVQIPLLFPGEDDMSGWTWEADVRPWPTYHSPLRFTFTTSAVFVPADEATDTPAYTAVTLFLPRQLNYRTGKGSWELHSVSPYEGPIYPDTPVPDGVDEEDWPPTTQIKTWLYGNVTVVPRTNDTDFLPKQPDDSPIVVVSHNWPNGMVP